MIYIQEIITFTFSITTIDKDADAKYWLASDDIEGRFIIDDAHPYIYCYIDYFTDGISRCRISSIPL
ncbi:unnamed protein product, partial [Rotaria magnacalcarata]